MCVTLSCTDNVLYGKFDHKAQLEASAYEVPVSPAVPGIQIGIAEAPTSSLNHTYDYTSIGRNQTVVWFGLSCLNLWIYLWPLLWLILDMIICLGHRCNSMFLEWLMWSLILSVVCVCKYFFPIANFFSEGAVITLLFISIRFHSVLARHWDRVPKWNYYYKDSTFCLFILLTQYL